MGRARDRASADLNGQEFILDADADTSISADTDDQIDIKIAGADDFQFTANTFTAQSGSTIAAQALTATTITTSSTVDVQGNEIILDDDGDTSITADTDDQVDIKVGGTDTVVIKPDEMILQGPHPSFTLTDSDDTNGGGVFYNNGSLSVAADTGNTGATGLIKFSIDGNEDVRIDGGGDLTINDGNLVIGTSGHGIDFSANTQSSVTGVSNQSELLDYYEEGTWTPAPYGTSTAGSVTSGTTVGRYTRVGNVVYAEYRLSAIVLSSAAGSYYIGGLPYTVGGTAYNGGSAAFHSVTFDGDHLIEANASSTSIYFIVSRSGTSWTSLQTSAFGSQHYSHGSVWYTVG